MIELSIEEKAERYDKSFERAKEQLNGAKVFDYDNEQIAHDIRTTVYGIFPELKESEDEKIRKELISYFKQFDNEELRGVNISDWITWLEKQGKHANFRNKIQIGDKVTRNDNGGLVNLSQLKRVAKKPEKQGEQNPADKVEQKGMNIVEEDMTPFQKKVFCIIDTAIEEEHGLKQVCDELLRLAHDEIMQNPAWSEEDEKRLKSCLNVLQAKGIMGVTDTINTKWLKSLKNRVGCEVNCTTKKEWSEDDEYNFAFIQEALLGLDGDDSYREKCCKMAEWLNSIKERVGNFDDGYKVGFSAAKHNQWKPSDEQMEVLLTEVTAWTKGCPKQIVLESLYNDLKKLREE